MGRHERALVDESDVRGPPATLLDDALGGSAERVIKERGRWASDIAFIYQRALVATHLDASAAVGRARGRDIEALCQGWVQPAGLR